MPKGWLGPRTQVSTPVPAPPWALSPPRLETHPHQSAVLGHRWGGTTDNRSYAPQDPTTQSGGDLNLPSNGDSGETMSGLRAQHGSRGIFFPRGRNSIKTWAFKLRVM